MDEKLIADTAGAVCNEFEDALAEADTSKVDEAFFRGLLVANQLFGGAPDEAQVKGILDIAYIIAFKTAVRVIQSREGKS